MHLHVSQSSEDREPTPRDEFIFNVWAPELHRLDSAWYIYFTAAPPDRGKPSHRTLVLKSTNPEPMVAASWKFLGLIRNMPDHRQIDSTVFTTVHGLFCCYSGWPPGDKSDTQQYLYLVKLRTPEGAIPESLVCISRPELPRERFEDNKRGIDTAPTFLDTSFVTGLVYSASCSWSSERKLALLYLDGDPMKTSSSRNRQTPLLVSDERPPFGPGQASFIKSSLNDMVCCIYHAQARQDDHWHRRQARVLLLAAKDFQDTADSICCAQA